MPTVAGSIEVIRGEESRAIPVAAASLEAVPVIVAAVYGLSNIVPASTVGGAVAAWGATTEIGEPVRVLLWPEAEIPEPRPQPEDEEPQPEDELA